MPPHRDATHQQGTSREMRTQGTMHRSAAWRAPAHSEDVPLDVDDDDDASGQLSGAAVSGYAAPMAFLSKQPSQRVSMGKPSGVAWRTKVQVPNRRPHRAFHKSGDDLKSVRPASCTLYASFRFLRPTRAMTLWPASRATSDVDISVFSVATASSNSLTRSSCSWPDWLARALTATSSRRTT